MRNNSSPHKYVQTPEGKQMHRTRGIYLTDKNALQDKTRQDKTRQDKTRQDKTREYILIKVQFVRFE
jgi:hypothetical protein